MNRAEQIKAAHTTVNPHNGDENYDYDAICEECEKSGFVDQNWEEESTKYTFPDGSVLTLCGNYVNTYAMDS